MMTREKWAQVVRLMRAAPLANMEVAEAVSQLIEDVGQHVQELEDAMATTGPEQAPEPVPTLVTSWED